MSTAWITDSHQYHRRDQQIDTAGWEPEEDDDIDPRRCECDDTTPVLCLDCMIREWDTRHD